MKHLVDDESIEQVTDFETEVEYFHIMFDRHEIVYSNGVAAESLFAGAEALKSVGEEARKELFRLFPKLSKTGEGLQLGARAFLSGRQGRKLVFRHNKNNKPLIQH